MQPFRLVELQGAGESFQHAVGDAAEVAAFEAGVVVDAHPGEQGDFLAAQAGDPAGTAVDRQPRLLRGDLGASGGQEVPDLGSAVHVLDATSATAKLGGSGITWNSSITRQSWSPTPWRDNQIRESGSRTAGGSGVRTGFA